ncbi:glycosyltransferase [Myroides sp. DW712]|uniref:glycosyltransferase n=1 Tax=Myroides sp. DW712 TaxID=3389800 RepID=UPI00397CD90B
MEIKKIKILYIATSTMGGGGVARMLSQKTAAFVQLGHEVKIMSTNDVQQQPFYLFDAQVQWELYPHSIRTMWQMRTYYSFVQEQGINTFQPDIIFVLDNGIKGYFASYFLKTHVPIYFEVHGSRHFLLAPITSPFRRSIINRITLALSKRFTGLIVLNESSKRDWKHPNIQVIPNWIAPENTAQVAKESASKQVIAIGRLVPEKNYETMLRIWKQIHQIYPDWKLVICGTGEETYVAQLKELADASVHWKGEVADVNSELQASAFMLHTSKMEGMPMAFLEAMVLGVPVVAFDVDYGPADLIQHGRNGYLIPLGEQQLMVHCCCILMQDPHIIQAFGKEAKKSMEQYDESVVLQQWISFFESLG